MQKERDALVKLFRQLAEEGRKYNASITLLDLRWGITDDQKRNGEVISTCLQEIDNSRPFFIGLIGDRYGWVPSSEEFKVSDLLLKFPCLQQYSDKKLSITEIEMRYGVLDNNNKLNSLFLLKSGILPETDNLNNLIEDIKQSPQTRLFTYDSVNSLVEIVRKEFLKIIKDGFQLGDTDPLEKITNIQKRVKYEKADGYVEIGDYLDRLNRWIEDPTSVLAVIGERGVGKTSLISYWLKETEQRFDNVLYYFIGEAGNSDKPVEIQKYFINKLALLYGSDIVIDENDILDTWDVDYSFEFELALKEVVKNENKILIVIDGLDHLEPTLINQLLFWLPEVPNGVKMLLSTSEGHATVKALTEINKFPVLEMCEFTKEEAAKIIGHILSHYGKGLSHHLIEKLTSNKLFRNGATLRILLDDLLAYGVHEEIPLQIEKYATSENINDFFGLIIDRAENFYGKESVRSFLLILLLSKYGLEENDIRCVLELKPIDWSELYCGLRSYLMFFEGKFALKYPVLIEVIDSRYKDLSKKELHRISKKIINNISNREEEVATVAWLAYLTDDIELLHKTIISFTTLTKLLIKDPGNLFLYWEELSASGYSFNEYLSSLPNDKEILSEFIPIIAEQVEIRLNDYKLSIKFLDFYLNLLGDTEDDISEKISFYLLIGRIYNKYGEITDSQRYACLAKEMLEQQNRNLDSNWGEYYFLVGSNYFLEEEYEQALDYHQKSLELSRKDKYHQEEYEWPILNRIGLDLIKLERYEEALKILEKALELSSSLMTSQTMESSQIINNIGYLYLQMKRYEKAKEYLERAVEQLREGFVDKNLELYLPMCNLALSYKGMEDYEKAKNILSQMFDVLKANENSEPTQFSYIYLQQGEIEVAKRHYSDAIKLFKKSIKVLGDEYFAPEPYNALVNVYFDLEKYNKAIDLLEKMDKQANKCLGFPNYSSAYAIENQAYLYRGTGKEDKARKFFIKAIDLYEALEEVEKVNELKEFLA